MTQKTEDIDVESLIENIFDYIAELYAVHLPSTSKVDQLHIKVHTGEAESFEQWLDLTADNVTIDTGDAELLLPFDVVATVDGRCNV